MLALFSIGAWAIEAGKVYTIKAHFSNRNDLYFTVRGGQLCFDQMREASENIYKWEAVDTGHTTYRWAFKNVATNKYLNGRGGNVVDAYTTGSNEVGCFKITECSGVSIR